MYARVLTEKKKETNNNKLLKYVIVKRFKEKQLGTLSSDDDDAGENVRKTIVLISKTPVVHLHYNLWYISLPSSAKQRREMTTIKVFWRTSMPDD